MPTFWQIRNLFKVFGSILSRPACPILKRQSRNINIIHYRRLTPRLLKVFCIMIFNGQFRLTGLFIFHFSRSIAINCQAQIVVLQHVAPHNFIRQTIPQVLKLSSWSVFVFGRKRPSLFAAQRRPTILVPPIDVFITGITSASSALSPSFQRCKMVTSVGFQFPFHSHTLTNLKQTLLLPKSKPLALIPHIETEVSSDT